MMEYKRVTDKDWHNEKFYGHSNRERTILKRLWDLENKIENGTLIELPCKIGDLVYKIMHVCGHRRIVEFEVCRISIYEDICIFFHKPQKGWNEWCTKPHHLGVNIFLTREEAEKRLEELKK